MSTINIAVCTLNQWALDFDGNCQRIIESIKIAKDRGAALRVGPELEICGYSCEDAFFEMDTVLHSYQVLAEIIQQDFKDIIIDVGMPISKDSTLYNCRVILLNSKIIMIRPKTKLAGNGNYREPRWFTAWDHEDAKSTWFKLPPLIATITNQSYVPFGSNIVLELDCGENFTALNPVRIGWEICEELWRPDATNVKLFGERGCHIICNSSGSYWEIRKLDRALDLMRTATSKSGGVYAFSNLVGCDGARICFYGRSLIAINGQLIVKTNNTKAELFQEVQVAMATINVNDIDVFRTQNNIKIKSHLGVGHVLQFHAQTGFANPDINQPVVNLTINVKGLLCDHNQAIPIAELNQEPLIAEEQILIYGSLWLWDYLRRSSMSGFILPLSGGLDSASVACIVYSMATILFDHLTSNHDNYTNQVSRVLRMENDAFYSTIKSAKELCHKLLRCAYLATKFSGTESRDRAANLASLIGSEFVNYNFNHLYEEISTNAPQFGPQFSQQSANPVTLLQQNLQARLRMVLTYYLSGGDKLVLAAGNVDESIVGYLTKYDCSSADLNPIGSISKQDLRRFMAHFEKTFFEDQFRQSAISTIILATPSAELTGSEQTDEQDLGLTYEELSLLGRHRRGEFGCHGPLMMFEKLWSSRGDEKLVTEFPAVSDARQLAIKVKRFFSLYARNRHKQTTITPALHSETYSVDDNRFDHRPFLTDSTWKWQFRKIDDLILKIEADN